MNHFRNMYHQRNLQKNIRMTNISYVMEYTWYDYSMLILTLVIGIAGITLTLKTNKISKKFNDTQSKRLKVSPQLEELFYSKLESLTDTNKSKENKKYLMDIKYHVECVYDNKRFKTFTESFSQICSSIIDDLANKELESDKKIIVINKKCVQMRALLRNEFFE